MSKCNAFLGYNVLQIWPRPHPGRGPKPFKFKGPKHQYYVVGQPQYQQPPYYPQVPQYPYPLPVEEPRVNPQEVYQYLENVKMQMQEFAARAYKEFQGMENELDRNRIHVEDSLKNQFQTLEVILEARQSKEIQQAIKDGKDELKIQECMAEEENDFRDNMNADIQRTSNCIVDATETARKAINGARNTYTESSYLSSIQVRGWAQKMRECAERGDNRCVLEGKNLIEDKTKSTVQEGSLYFQQLQEVSKLQKTQLDYCRENFIEDLRDMRESYSKMVKRCVIASEIQEPEEIDDEKENGGKVNVNVEVKPDAGIEGGIETEI